jgi:hypothetical protein
MNITVQSLRKNGVKVRCLHQRYLNTGELMPIYEIRQKHLQHLIKPKGGILRIEVTKDNQDYISEAKCSGNDPYCRRTGIAIALGRLAKNTEIFKNLQ